MNIIVCIKPVPDPDKYDLLTIDPETKRLVREGIPTIVNPSDRNALEAALKLKEQFGGKVTILSMTPAFSADRLKLCLAMGADDAIILSDREFGGADTLATSYTLMKAIESKQLKYDLILAGNESADGATSHVPTQLAEWLGVAHITNVRINAATEKDITVEKKTETGRIEYKIEYPAVLAIEKGSNEPRYISAMGIEALDEKNMEILDASCIDTVPEMIGLKGSPTQPGELFVQEVKRESKEIKGNNDEIADQIIALIKKEGISQFAQAGGEK